jgi:methionyl-tRNA formyltransferase
MRILFIGSGDIGLPSLNHLLNLPLHDVVGVVTQPDKPAGRKLAVVATAIKQRAREEGLPVIQPKLLRTEVSSLRVYRPDLAVVIAYGQILSPEMLALPKYGCINVHASLLPKYRGASPIQAAIVNGDSETGLTIMQMDVGLDTGPIYQMTTVPISSTDTGGSLHDKLALAAPRLLEDVIKQIEKGKALPVAQDDSQASLVTKLNKDHGNIDWTKSVTDVERLIRAYAPWPGTHTYLNGAMLKIHAATIASQGSHGCPLPGTILAADVNDGLRIACGKGILMIREIQAEGRKRLPVQAYLAGHKIEVGAIFGGPPTPIV